MFSPALLARRASESWIDTPPVEVVQNQLSISSRRILFGGCSRCDSGSDDSFVGFGAGVAVFIFSCLTFVSDGIVAVWKYSMGNCRGDRRTDLTGSFIFFGFVIQGKMRGKFILQIISRNAATSIKKIITKKSKIYRRIYIFFRYFYLINSLIIIV